MTIAVVGDSVAESSLTRGGATQGLAPQIAAALARRGFARGGQGYIPPMLSRWSFSRPVPPRLGPPPRGAWELFGYGRGPYSEGLSGYGALATSARATARLRARGPDIGVLYVTTPAPAPFTVRAAGRTYRLNAFAPGPPRPHTRWLKLPPGGVRTLTVNGPSRGLLIIGGAIDRRPVAPGRVQVETHNLGHVRLLPQEALAPRITGAFARQRYDITVFLWGYLAQVVGDPAGKPDALSEAYERGLLARARLARRGRGVCVISDTTPIPVPRAVAELYSAIHARVAATAGCAHTDVLSSLWDDPASAFETGHTLVDDIHPTLGTYRRMGDALATVLEPLVRARAPAGG